ncbi:SusC/RagA family TonB-linked outer membrane protein [Pseudochryseolinea flava]|uniref:SusC/RagA family TonB-linked outer membrane protein n=1 Tax=Pseudochryseolinea flava TaxID=2059302 RepID=A0A364Y390_9BACT|nr:SusC/RagA family TonB-linked outer membrane protein [Pseudochryseolinea flava]RAW01256.1 SusC/RagA family TonB-linked outer membrane protein [Pseudochryseolinea flava]
MRKNYQRKWRVFFPVFLLLLSTSAFAQVTVKGKITSSEDGTAMPGVNIVEKGTSTGTVTDVDGNYSIVVSEGAVLVFSFIGFDTQEVLVKDQSDISVALAPNVKLLSDVVVVGYGTQRKRDLTGSVVQVDAKQLENENPNSVTDILRGNVPGVNVVGYGVSAKGNANLEVRGQNSINAGTSPLIVVDGVIYYGDLADINPNDIDKVDVLKDASSAAVFGAKAASGVILITTKKGTTTKPVINVNSTFGFVGEGVQEHVYQGEAYLNYRADVARAIKATDPAEKFADPRNLPPNITIADWLAYDGATGDPVDVWLGRLGLTAIEIENFKAGKTINWENEVFQRGKRQDHTVSISGKGERVSYYWSLGYTDNEGIIAGDKFSTFRNRFNLDVEVTNYLSLGTNLQFAARDESQVPADWGQIVRDSPYGSFYDNNGELRYSPQDDPGGNSRNPFLSNHYNDKKRDFYTITPTLYAKVTLPFGFSYQANFTPRLEWHRDYQSISAKHPDWISRGGNASRYNHQLYYWQLDNIIKWEKTFGDHRFDATFLANAEKYQFWSSNNSNIQFDPNDNLGYHNLGAGSTPVISTSDDYSTGDALMARMFYSFREKYMLTYTIRRDGYSAFGTNNPRATFSSFGAAWLFSDENFLTSASWLDNGKLRVTWGANGNRDIGRYDALSDLTSGKYLYASATNGNAYTTSQLFVNRMSNNKLKWEETKALNVGLDFSILKGLVSGSIDAYKSNTTNLLIRRSLPDILGFSNVWDNLGEVENKGLEISLTSKNMVRENFEWRTTLNLSMNRNKILHLYGNMVNVLDAEGNVIGQKEGDDKANGWFIGHAIDAVWNYKVLGVWQTNEADQAAEYGQKPGDFKLLDKNGDKAFSDDDKEFLGYYKPRVRWSLRNDFTIFKNFDVSFMLYSLWGHINTYNQAKNDYSSGLLLDRNNSYVVPYWTPENPTNNYARLNSNSGGAAFNVYRKKSIIRLDNISVGYTIPKAVLDKVRIQRMKVFASVRNVGFYAPEWEFWDPEIIDGNGPTPRTWTFGVDLSL